MEETEGYRRNTIFTFVNRGFGAREIPFETELGKKFWHISRNYDDLAWEEKEHVDLGLFYENPVTKETTLLSLKTHVQEFVAKFRRAKQSFYLNQLPTISLELSGTFDLNEYN